MLDPYGTIPQFQGFNKDGKYPNIILYCTEFTFRDSSLKLFLARCYRYDTKTSSHLWPSVDYTDTLWNTLATTNTKVEQILNQQCDSTKYAKNLGKMVIYLEDFSYTSIDESPDYGIWTFLSDFGGILGLYVGLV